MTPVMIAAVVAVVAVLWWAAKPHTTNHAENDEATSRGGSFHEGEHHGSH